MPGRITAVHLGLGAFHRAHQLWATEAANRKRLADGAADADLDGYASFTGRRFTDDATLMVLAADN